MFDSLKEFAFISGRLRQHIPQEVSRDLLQALSGHSRLRKLELKFTNVGKLVCSELVDLLSNSNINLKVLNLNWNHLGVTEAAALARGITRNTSLK
jgi:Ran GTPase-activating protein (RanGAP) involved in mRNA processing and transport